MKRLENLVLAAAAAFFLAAAGALLDDGPSEADVVQAVADDLEDARQQAQHAKREIDIETVLHNYAKLAGSKQ